MASSFDFNAEMRSAAGTGGARALRREGKVVAVLYGGGAEPALLSLDHKDVIKNLENEAVYSHILNIHVDGRTEQAVLKDIQRHPSRPLVLHMDFQRVSRSEKVKMHVPLHFVGEDISVGVKKGGVVMHSMVDVDVSCLPGSLPEYIEVDISALDVGESIHLSDLVVPAGVEISALAQGADHDLPVAAIQAGRTADAGGAEDESGEA